MEQRDDLRITPRGALAGTLAAALGVSLAVAVSRISQTGAYAADGNAQHVEACITDYARLESNHGLSAHVVNARRFAVGAKVLNMHATDPSCNDADVVRSSNVVVTQNGREIGHFDHFINPHNDTGRPIDGSVHTSTTIGCGDTEKVTFITEAHSSEVPGATTTSAQSFSFTTRC